MQCNAMQCNVKDTISWRDHHDRVTRVMQLNWLYYFGICQLIPLRLWGTQHKAATINQLVCPSYFLCIQLLWYPMYYPGGIKARVGPVQWSKPHSILVPTQDSNPGDRIQNDMRWPLHYTVLHTESYVAVSSGVSVQCSHFLKWINK